MKKSRIGYSMLDLALDWTRFRSVLCLGAHCDDLEIGCGGTLAELRARAPQARFHWCVFSGDAGRHAEARRAAAHLLGADATLEIELHDFRNSYFPQYWAGVKESFEALASRVQPDLVFTHRTTDQHQDHRVVGELTWNTFRRHRIFEYEIVKYEGDLGQPNAYIALAKASVARKLATLAECFPSQRDRSWYREDVFRGLMAIRGVECAAPSGYAEAFHVRKLAL